MEQKHIQLDQMLMLIIQAKNRSLQIAITTQATIKSLHTTTKNHLTTTRNSLPITQLTVTTTTKLVATTDKRVATTTPHTINKTVTSVHTTTKSKVLTVLIMTKLQATTAITRMIRAATMLTH
jgi:hypothetical protein